MTCSPCCLIRPFFIGDQVGGSGWEVELPDGLTKKFYVQLPEDVRLTTKLHLGKAVETGPEDQTASDLSTLYIDYLRRLLADAVTRFG
jgi:hypothetical protein